MAERTTRPGSTCPASKQPASSAAGRDPLRESLDELERLADSLVDALTLEQPAPEGPVEPPAAEETEESRRAAFRQTLDALDHLIEDPSPQPVPAEAQLDEDRGEDISDRLDCLLSTALVHEPPSDEARVDIEAEQPDQAMVIESSATASTADAPAETAVLEIGDTEETEEEETEEIEEPEGIEPELPLVIKPAPVERRRRSGVVYWMLAILVALGAAAGLYWFLQSPTGTPPTVAEVPMPNPPVVYSKPHHGNPKPASERPVPIEAAAVTAVPTPKPALPAQPKIDPVIEPIPARPEDATVSYASEPTIDTAPVATFAAIEPVVEPASTRPDDATNSYAAPVAEPTPVGVPTSETAELQIGSLHTFLVPDPSALAAPPKPVTDAPAPSPTAEPRAEEPVAAPADRPPVVLQRIEPAYDSRTIPRGEVQTVVLRVLVSESGRAARVVVAESTRGAETEAAAIGAVLRWTYQPALEDGQPVRRWTTERFEFSHPSD